MIGVLGFDVFSGRVRVQEKKVNKQNFSHQEETIIKKDGRQRTDQSKFWSRLCP